MNINFSYSVDFDDGNPPQKIEFEAEFSKGGFNYCYGNEKGFREEVEMGEIYFDGAGLTNEQCEYIEEHVLDSQPLKDKAWDAYNNQVNA